MKRKLLNKKGLKSSSGVKKMNERRAQTVIGKKHGLIRKYE